MRESDNFSFGVTPVLVEEFGIVAEFQERHDCSANVFAESSGAGQYCSFTILDLEIRLKYIMRLWKLI